MISVYVFRLCFLLADGNGCLTNNSQPIAARLVNASCMHTGIALYMITELKMTPLGDAVNMPAFSKAFFKTILFRDIHYRQILTTRTRFLDYLWNDNRQNGNNQNYWYMKQEKIDSSKNRLKTDQGLSKVQIYSLGLERSFKFTAYTALLFW